MEGDDVVCEQAFEHRFANVRWQDAPVVRLAPRDMHKMVQECPRMSCADDCGGGVEVVIVEHDRGVGVLVEQRVDLFAKPAVDGLVPVLPGVEFLPTDVRSIREIPEVVLDKPQNRVGDHVVVPVVRVVVDDDESSSRPLPEAFELEPVVAGFGRDQPILARDRSGHPDCGGCVKEPRKRRDEATTAPPRHPSALAYALERHWSAIGDQDQGIRHDIRAFVMHPRTLPGGRRPSQPLPGVIPSAAVPALYDDMIPGDATC